MKLILAVILMACASCKGGVAETVQERTKQAATDVVYENTGGLPIWPGYRIGGISKEVARPVSEESNLDRVIRIVSTNALIVSGVLFIVAVVMGIASTKVPGAGHLAAFAGAGSALMLVIGAFTSWIIYGLGAACAFMVGYVVWLAVSADRRKKMVLRLNESVSNLDKSFGEVVQSMDLVKRAPSEQWDDAESALRKAVDALQSENTKELVKKVKGG
jgi:hypothetical protein